MPAASNPESVFVVGTGRCGSTLISNLLRRHTEVLSLSQFFASLTDMYRLTESVFPHNILTARGFWDILSARNTVSGLLARNNVLLKEILYPATSLARRYAPGEVPAVLLTALPHLSGEPDDLYDEIATVIRAFPDSSIGDHYGRLFGWLCQRFGKTVWGERSGASLMLTRQYIEHFPGARFVHIVRDGRDCALSMSRHWGFKMRAIVAEMVLHLGHDPYSLGVPDPADVHSLPEELRCFLPDRFDVKAFLAYQIPSAIFGKYWSDEIERGLSALSVLPSGRVLHVCYEDILDYPAESISRFIEFAGPPGYDCAMGTPCSKPGVRPRVFLDAATG